MIADNSTSAPEASSANDANILLKHQVNENSDCACTASQCFFVVVVVVVVGLITFGWLVGWLITLFVSSYKVLACSLDMLSRRHICHASLKRRFANQSNNTCGRFPCD